MAAWTDVLDRIEQSLQQSLRLAEVPPPVPRRDGPQQLPALERVDARLRQWQATLEKAERSAAEADAALAAEHAALQGCRERLGLVIEALTKWCERPTD